MNKQGQIEISQGQDPAASPTMSHVSALNNWANRNEQQQKPGCGPPINHQSQTQSSHVLSPVNMEFRLHPTTARGSQQATYWPPMTRGSHAGSLHTNGQSPGKGISVHELNVSAEHSRHAITNWRKCRGMPQLMKNRWALEMQKKTQQMKKRQQ